MHSINIYQWARGLRRNLKTDRGSSGLVLMLMTVTDAKPGPTIIKGVGKLPLKYPNGIRNIGNQCLVDMSVT